METSISAHCQFKSTDLFTKFETINELNLKIEELTGIKTFFRNDEDFTEFQNYLNNPEYFNFSDKLREHGDYQTPSSLTEKICNYLLSIGCSPDVVIEPTYGRGTFITLKTDLVSYKSSRTLTTNFS